MESTANALNWFEIPVDEIERAQDFYQGIFDMEMIPMQEMPGMKMVAFPIDMESGKVGGSLVKSDNHYPSEDGAVIYLNANPDMQIILDRVEELGGEIVMPRTQISPEIGYMAFIIDTEGNKVGLHSNN